MVEKVNMVEMMEMVQMVEMVNLLNFSIRVASPGAKFAAGTRPWALYRPQGESCKRDLPE